MNVGTESVASFVGKPPLKRKMPHKLRDFFEMNIRQSISHRNQRHQETRSTSPAARIAPMRENTGVGPGGSDL